jgi:RHS repeat-associated protein
MSIKSRLSVVFGNAKRSPRLRKYVWWQAKALLFAVLAAPLCAHALEVAFGGRNRVLDPNYYDQLFGRTEALLQPGDGVLIDDWFHNTLVNYSSAVAGDSLGIRSTNPNGVVSLNTVSDSGGCWHAGLATYCPAYSSGGWEFGTGVRFQPLGQWKVEVLKNSAVVATVYFQLRPYALDFYAGLSQSIPIKSITPVALAVRLTRPDGTPAGLGREVTFVLSSKPGGASPPGGITNLPTYTGTGSTPVTVQTDADGVAKTYFETGGKAGNYVITASAPTAPGVTKTFTVAASGSDPLDAAATEKNLGVDPANNSSCSAATNPFTSNPINVATGNKIADESDYEGAGVFPLRLLRYYNSKGTRAGSFGANWRGYYDRNLVITSTTLKGKTTTVAEAIRPDGRVLRFTLTNGAWVADPDVVDRLQSITGGYRFTCGNDQVETYNSAGQLGAVAAREGFAQSLAYDGQNRLTQVTDAFGRTLALQYDTSNRVSLVTDPAGKTYTYAYSAAGNLTSVRYPDLALRQYHYENAAFPRALTGITDENGVRFATYDYDSAGRAIRSTHAGGAMQRTVYYYTNGTRDVLDAVGNPRRYAFAVIQGVDRRTSLDNAACASCGNAVMSTGYSTSGFVASLTDYRGTPTSFVRDTRGLETSRTEAVGQTEARNITTAWHATFRLPLTITRPGQRTTYTYDSSGRMTSSTLTDTATGATRSWAYTYDAQGLLAMVNGPRTDVADITQYSYDAQGNLATTTNALGHLTRFTSYDAHGRPLAMTDPNGLITTYAYDLRGRLTSRNAGGQVTSYSHDPAGQLIRITRPDATWLEHQYDAAHRLVGQLDSGGHRLAYTLDAEGRRIRQEHFDASGNSTYLRRFTFDPLGRVLSEIDALDRVQRRYIYDANGNRVADTDAFGASATLAYDRLDRLSQRSDALGASTAYAYDGRDNLTRVTDPVGAITSYTYDGLDNRVQEASPDAGTHSFGYDSAGNLRTRNWPNARAVTLNYDALDRPVLEDYGSSVQVAYIYDSGANGIGRLVGLTDPAGSTGWGYDLWGRVLQKSRATGTRTLATGYGYDSAGRLVNLTYPSGRVLGQGYNAGGRVASMTLDGSPLVGGIEWLPFGPPRSWTQGNGRFVNKSFDRDGQLLAQDFEGGTRALAYDAKGRITQVAEWGGYTNYGYDAVDRLNSQTTGANGWSYGYDGNGNRISQSTPAGATGYAYSGNRLASASGVEARSFVHDAAGNLIVDGGSSYTYDARNRLAQAPGAAFGYDGQGLRVLKSTATTPRYYAHDLDRRVLGEYDAASTVYETVWLGATPIAVMKGGQRYWVDADQIDAPRVVRDETDQIVWRWYSEAFGNSVANEDPSGLGSFEFNLRFPGQVYDRETGLYYNDQRDYSPRTGRYVESDPIGLAGGINTYAYAESQPTSLTDPMGLATYLCTQPLHALGKVGEWVYAPQSNKLHHKFIGVLRPDGSTFTGAQDRAGKPWSDGKPSEGDGAHGNHQCEKVEDDNECLEQCLLPKMLSTQRPKYALIPGTINGGENCQSWAEQTVDECRKQCKARR